MKSAVLCLAFALALTTAFEYDDEVVPEDQSTYEIAPEEDMFLQAQQELHAKGNGACKKVAKDLEDVVKANVAALQKAQDEMDKGLDCDNSGQSGVNAAKKTLNDAETKRNNAQTAYDAAASAKVEFGSKNLDEIEAPKCDFIFELSSYKDAIKKREDAKKKLEEAKGEVTSAETGLKNAEEAAKKAVQKCKCDTFTAHNTALGAKNEQAEKANKKGWTKAQHLECVLDGTAYNECKVSDVPKVKAAKGLCEGCDEDACSTMLPTYTGDTCSGFRVLPEVCGKGKVALAMSKSSTWDKEATYSCPEGWYWPTAKKYFDFLAINGGCKNNNNKAIQAGHVYKSKCGWNNLKPPNYPAPGSCSLFRFADSATNGNSQQAQSYPGKQNINPQTSSFCGIACIKDGF